MEKDSLTLFFENKALVPYIIEKLKINLPQKMEWDDLFQIGYLGLLEAASRYEGGPAKFSTYAYYRVKGAILDGVYAYQDLGKNCTKDASLYLVAVEELKTRVKGTVTREDVSHYLGIKSDKAVQLERLAVIMVANEECKHRPMPEYCRVELGNFDLIEERMDLRNAMKHLEPEELIVIRWRCYMERGFKELEELSGIGRGRLQRLYEKGVMKLRKAMEAE